MKDYYPVAGDYIKVNGLEILVGVTGIVITSGMTSLGLAVYPRAENKITVESIKPTK